MSEISKAPTIGDRCVFFDDSATPNIAVPVHAFSLGPDRYFVLRTLEGRLVLHDRDAVFHEHEICGFWSAADAERVEPVLNS